MARWCIFLMLLSLLLHITLSAKAKGKRKGQIKNTQTVTVTAAASKDDQTIAKANSYEINKLQEMIKEINKKVSNYEKQLSKVQVEKETALQMESACEVQLISNNHTVNLNLQSETCDADKSKAEDMLNENNKLKEKLEELNKLVSNYKKQLLKMQREKKAAMEKESACETKLINKQTVNVHLQTGPYDADKSKAEGVLNETNKLKEKADDLNQLVSYHEKALLKINDLLNAHN